MALYIFYVFKSTSPVASIEVADLEDDEAAIARAGSLCGDLKSCVRLEIWQEERLVVDRPCAGGRRPEDQPGAAPLDQAQDVPSAEFVKTTCPTSGRVVQTHARLTKAQVEKLKTSIVYWCSLCRCVHEAGRDDLLA